MDAIVKTLKFFSFIIFFSQCFIVSAFAQTNLSRFMTPRDLLNNDSVSNISLQNNRGSAATVYGIYVRQYAYVTPGQSCDSATVIYSATGNITAGAFVMPTVINSGKRAAVGSNYLYNMLYQAIYYENIIIPASPPGCALPGCTWGSDSTQYNWCIYLGALAPVSTSSGYTAKVPPSADAASSSGLYNYNLISSYSYLGPISCNDRTLTCTTASQQTQSFS
jgi:hypothetical protein